MAKQDEAIDVVQDAPLSLSREKLRGRLAQDVLRNTDAMERIGDQIATADTVDAILADNAVHAEDILNTALDVRGFVLRPASDEFIKDSEGKSESFAVMEVVVIDNTPRGYGTGDILIVTCGGYNVQNALIRYAELNGERQPGLFNHPLRCAIKEAGRALRLYKPEPATIADPFRVVDA